MDAAVSATSMSSTVVWNFEFIQFSVSTARGSWERLSQSRGGPATAKFQFAVAVNDNEQRRHLSYVNSRNFCFVLTPVWRCYDVIHTTCRILLTSRDGSTKFTAKLVTQLGDSGWVVCNNDRCLLLCTGVGRPMSKTRPSCLYRRFTFSFFQQWKLTSQTLHPRMRYPFAIVRADIHTTNFYCKLTSSTTVQRAV